MTTIAIINEKGGVGKTTSTVNLAAAWAGMGKRVLLVDFDPQANATTHCGMAANAEPMLAALLSAPLATLDTKWGFELVAGGRQLANAQGAIDSQLGILRLKQALFGLPHDLILIDCPPTLSFLPTSALVAADVAVVPLQPAGMAIAGLAQLERTIGETQALNADLDILALIPCDYDQRRNHDVNKLSELRELYPGRVLNPIPTDTKIKEAFDAGQPVLAYDTGGRGAKAYRQAATTLLEKLDV